MWTPPVAGLRHSGCPRRGPGSPGVPSCWQQQLQYLLSRLLPELLASPAWCPLAITHWHTHPHRTYLLRFPQLLSSWIDGPLWPVALVQLLPLRPLTHSSLSIRCHHRHLGPLGSWSHHSDGICTSVHTREHRTGRSSPRKLVRDGI